MKIHFRLSDERLITPTGISLVGRLLATSNFIRIINRLPIEKKRSQPQIPTGDILLCYIALLCQAKTGFDNGRTFSGKTNRFLRKSTIPQRFFL